jgi:hypothetical protein
MHNKFLTQLSLGLILVFVGSTLLLAQADGGGQGRRNRNAQNNGGNGNQGNQGQRNRNAIDPAQAQQRFMDRYKELLEITDETEWKAIGPLVEKMTTARREVPGGFNRGGRRNNNDGQTQTQATASAMGDLQKALETKASNNELKVKMAAVAEERQVKEAVLQQTQENLRKVLTVRQEGLAIVNGLLPAKKP